MLQRPENRHVWIVSDEIYHRLTMDAEVRAPSFASLPEMGSRTIIIDGCSKGYAMTGFRLGETLGAAEDVQWTHCFLPRLLNQSRPSSGCFPNYQAGPARQRSWHKRWLSSRGS